MESKLSFSNDPSLPWMLWAVSRANVMSGYIDARKSELRSRKLLNNTQFYKQDGRIMYKDNRPSGKVPMPPGEDLSGNLARWGFRDTAIGGQ